MARISAQIDQLKKRLRDETDPMLEEVLTSLQQLQRLETVEGLIEFHEQQYCGRAEACEITGKPSETIRQYIDNYIQIRFRISLDGLVDNQKNKGVMISLFSLKQEMQFLLAV